MLHDSKQILIITGPTSAGKTSLALKLARKFGGEILSADSRQVYIGMDIGTGKDLPSISKFQISNIKYQIKSDYYQYGYYEIDGVKVWGLDIARPDQEFSVSHYVIYAKTAIADIVKRGKLPVVVGGTGLYIQSIINPPETIDVPQNTELRDDLYKRPVAELKNMLKKVNPEKWDGMNNSDRNNPRRLIRAVEVAKYLRDDSGQVYASLNLSKKPGMHKTGYDFRIVGLKAQPEILRKRISYRINQRVKQGILKEIETLQKGGYGWNLPSMQALCYRRWKDFFDEKCAAERVLDRWEADEIDYARRQFVWFKKMENISWFDISDKLYTEKIGESIREWYNKRNYA